MFQSEHLVEKWAPLLDHDGGITDNHRKAVTAVLLENQEKFLREEQAFNSGHNLMETPTNSAGTGWFQRQQHCYGSCRRFRPRSDLPDQTLHAQPGRL